MAPRKTVLGNDPFRSGAAPREPGPEAPPPREPEKKKQQKPKPPAPPKSERQEIKETPPRPEARPLAPPPPPPVPSFHVPVTRGPPVSGGQALLGAASALMRLTGLGSTAPSLELDELGRDAQLERDMLPLLDFIYDRWFRVDCRGFERLPASGPVILVANRAGLVPWDSAMLTMAARRHGRDLRPLVEDYLFHFPAFGVLINRMGAVRASPENGERVLNDGGAVAVFPEGAQGMAKPFRQRYRLQRFGRGGFVKLALRTRATILPVAIRGSEETGRVLARLPGILGLPMIPVTPTFPWFGLAGLLPLPGHWVVEMGEPVDLSAAGPEGASDDPLVMRIAENTRDTIQAMLDRLGG